VVDHDDLIAADEAVEQLVLTHKNVSANGLSLIGTNFQSLPKEKTDLEIKQEQERKIELNARQTQMLKKSTKATRKSKSLAEEEW